MYKRKTVIAKIEELEEELMFTEEFEGGEELEIVERIRHLRRILARL